MFKRFFTALGVFLVIAVLFLVMQIITPKKIAHDVVTPEPASPASDGTVLRVGNAMFVVEIADTPQKQTQGLSDRESLPRDHGELFIFPAPGRYDFWMKDMHFPLDLIWIREGRVVGITENALPEGSKPAKIYSPPEDVDQVFEVNAGVVAEQGIKVGDEVISP